jgi:Ca2+-binding EF-hand superfamily protein
MESMDSDDPMSFFHELFNMLDNEQKGYLEIRDLRKFVSEMIGAITYNRSERIVRKMDRNGDGKIDRFEFIYMLTPFQSR